MNSEPDNYEYTDRIYGVHWTLAFAIPAAIWIAALCMLCGRTYTRQNAPVQFAPLLNIEVKDTANGNKTTVPLVGQQTERP